MSSNDKYRLDTPGCHNKIFLNSAGSSLMPKPVIQLLQDYNAAESLYGGYQTVPLFNSEVEKFYENASNLLHTKRHNIAFTFNATDAYFKALSSILFLENDVILTTDDDYISNQIAFMQLKNRFKIQVVRAKNLTNGDLDLEDFEAKIIRYKPKLVSVTHIPSNSGKIQAVEAIGSLCERYEIWYLVDACQSVGQMDVDVQKIKCDFLSATGRKFLRGPRGTGLLYVSDKALNARLSPINLDMRGASWIEEQTFKLEATAKRFEMWEMNYGNLIGLSTAISYALTVGLNQIKEINQQLCLRLKKGLETIPNLLLAEEGSMSGSIVTFFPSMCTLPQIESLFKEKNIYYSVGTQANALIDFRKKNLSWVIRFSPHYFNTFEEIDEALDVVSQLK